MWPFTKHEVETEETEEVVLTLSEEQTLTVAKMLDAGEACEAGQHHHAKAILWQYINALFAPEHAARERRKTIDTTDAGRYKIRARKPKAKPACGGMNE